MINPTSVRISRNIVNTTDSVLGNFNFLRKKATNGLVIRVNTRETIR